MKSNNSQLEEIKSKIEVVQDFPRKGVSFVDLFSLTEDPSTAATLFDLLEKLVVDANLDFDCFIGVEARGFIVGYELAKRFNKRFVPIRKAGKLPGDVVGASYTTEYSTDKIEIQKKKIIQNARVVVVDDLLATGGTLAATEILLNQVGASIVAFLVVFEVVVLKGAITLPKSATLLSLIKI